MGWEKSEVIQDFQTAFPSYNYHKFNLLRILIEFRSFHKIFLHSIQLKRETLCCNGSTGSNTARQEKDLNCAQSDSCDCYKLQFCLPTCCCLTEENSIAALDVEIPQRPALMIEYFGNSITKVPWEESSHLIGK